MPRHREQQSIRAASLWPIFNADSPTVRFVSAWVGVSAAGSRHDQGSLWHRHVPVLSVSMLLTFAGREYRPSTEELAALADELDERAQPRPVGIYRQREDASFGPLAARIRAAIVEPVSPVELNAQEGAALILGLIGSRVQSAELDRFQADYLLENEWTSRSLSTLFDASRSIGVRFALQIGRWFFEDGLTTPIGGIDEETGEDLWPRDVDFAWLAGANAAFADAASAWARFNGRTLADPHVHVEETLQWLRAERDGAAVNAAAGEDDESVARASGRAWALREAALWLEVAANRSRLPWEPPRHQA